jgi:hypothetical protein
VIVLRPTTKRIPRKRRAPALIALTEPEIVVSRASDFQPRGACACASGSCIFKKQARQYTGRF